VNYKKMPTSQLDKLLLDYVLEGNDSFYSDKQLAEMKVVYDKVLKDLFPEEDPKEIERSNGEFLNMMSEEQARRKLEADAKARRVVIGGETDPMHLTNPDDPFKVTSDLVKVHLLPFALKKKRVEWKSEFGSRFEDGFSIELQDKTPNPVMTREEAIAFAKHILAVTRQDTYRGV